MTMATTEQIIDAAGELGKMIGAHETAKRLETIAKKLEADVEAQRVLNDHNRHLQTLAEKEQAGKPIEVEDKRKLEQLQNQVAQNSLLREVQMVQMDYLDLMRRVEAAMVSRPDVPSGAAASSVIQ